MKSKHLVSVNDIFPLDSVDLAGVWHEELEVWVCVIVI